MSYLDLSGTTLYYEAVGKGPMLLCISGADGSCELWRGVAEQLKDRFTVVMYDRRGFSRSYLNGPQDYTHRLDGDADDAAQVIKQVSPNEPAYVIGNSSGAIVSLRLLTRHHDLLKKVIAYEPPSIPALPDSDEVKAGMQSVYDTYREKGVVSAYEVFAKVIEAQPAMVARMSDLKANQYKFSNVQYWFEREMIQYPFTDFDVEKEFGPVKQKLILANGELSKSTQPQYRANVEMGKKLGLEVVHVPGEHVGHATHGAQFGERLAEILTGKGE